ncbi:energy-coupling factor transport system ATP-binding protein [Cerasibacillus quisquiliarum]|uniref:Energy-coupling factor transporter ATP-binding protein EcfA2 n=1 Tax=Cerasibacillus quisquiliarum TaxID=227865 RepID=A0A511V2N4_9BACI|nr:energy-coupling factor ABC transporter ATP-binding protein [Cerasibacillus quisquiliarum]MBB5147189.1 energy-coupling factor transport system ATP-binding protein [Cerasibacillus quisquiliarum]GEN32003.1 energy-coupling factor transporter ATP-binding protein EcfA2 [Cerasibacillus quisquiliarum]
MDITFKDVSYIYQKNTPFAHKALDRISFHIPSGSFVAIIGHTGSGKSTLIQHLNGLITPSEGEVLIGDVRITNREKPKDMKTLRSQVGVVFQYPEHQLFEETIEKDIAFGPQNFGISEEETNERIKEVLPMVGLSEALLGRSPFDLSGGQMRRVAIAGVLAVKPRVLVLDEPTAGLDPRGQQEIMDMFYQLHQKEQLTTVLVTHSMEDAMKYADHILILNKGKIYMEGRPEDVFTEVEALNKVQLDTPEIIQFMNKFSKRFNMKIPFQRQTPKQLAKQMYHLFKGDERT